jgi:tetratricopeptide (TPR) repeat protein
MGREARTRPRERCGRRAELRKSDAAPPAQLYLGNLLWNEEELTEAEEAFKEAVRIWPDYSVTYSSLGTFYRGTGRPEEGKHCYRMALSLDSEDVGANIADPTRFTEIGSRKGIKAGSGSVGPGPFTIIREGAKKFAINPSRQ